MPARGCRHSYEVSLFVGEALIALMYPPVNHSVDAAVSAVDSISVHSVEVRQRSLDRRELAILVINPTYCNPHSILFFFNCTIDISI